MAEPGGPSVDPRFALGPVPPVELRRLFNREGVLAQMPSKADKRLPLLRWIASTLPVCAALSEIEINRLLRPIDSDVAMLRRYLVEAELVERPEPGVYLVPHRGDTQ